MYDSTTRENNRTPSTLKIIIIARESFENSTDKRQVTNRKHCDHVRQFRNENMTESRIRRFHLLSSTM